MNQEITAILITAAKKAGDVILSYYKKNYKISEKSNPRDLVTEADINAQKVIVDVIKNSMIQKGIKENEIGFIGEENLYQRAIHTFIIDPLDGTANFISESDRFCVSIAYAKNNEVLVGVIYVPIDNAIYFAEKGKGAFKIKDDQKTKLEIKSKELIKSEIAFNSSVRPDITQRIFKIGIALAPLVYGIKEEECFILTDIEVAENKYQASINGNSKIWDIAAIKLILEESGGDLIDWEGKEIICDFENSKKGYETISGHPKLIKEIVSYVKN
ncbi:inositol monophosphatase [Patescibacteria group bacterium]|nr:inositol monophosphatase [Patescibacteria group bacterium]